MKDALKRLEELASPGSVLGLERMELLLKYLDHPEKDFKAIHVAGTNGKGSTCAALSNILFSAGYRVGVYTSPHLIRFNERIKINGEEINDQDLDYLVERILKAIERWNETTDLEYPTQFEFYTALAFLYHSQKRVDLAVIETGLGGRLDATNLISPLVSILTPISRDHLDLLGGTLTEIAREKAGIIKPGITVVSAPQPEEVEEVIISVCHSLDANLYLLGRDTDFKLSASFPGEERFDYQGISLNLSDLSFGLLGQHQLTNAAVALTGIEALQRLGYEISDQSIAAGLKTTTWPGRLEVLKEQPRIVVDGAHNPMGAQVLAQALKQRFSYERLVLIVGVLKDKDIKGIFEFLIPLADLVILTRPVNERAAEPEDVRTFAEGLARGEVLIEPMIEKAISLAIAKAGPNDLICVAGSLYLIGEVKMLLE